MQLAQFNWFLDRGLIAVDDERRLVMRPRALLPPSCATS
jgi:hypothetical protein